MFDHDSAMQDLLAGQPVVPVLKIDRLETAIPLAQALVRGGLRVIEITLRTHVSLEAVRLVASEVPEAVVGAGTILDQHHYTAAVDAGATFIVSPGCTPALLRQARDREIPFLPGAITPSEMLALRDQGFAMAKFFPAEQAGGAAFLAALASPLAGMRFCPTGGVSLANAASYLALPNVACVGGSWVAPEAMVSAGRWDEIERLAAEAFALR